MRRARCSPHRPRTRPCPMVSREQQVREKTPGASQPGRPQPGVPLNLTLVYDSGTEVQTQDILQIQADTQLFTNETGRAQLKVSKIATTTKSIR